MNSTPAENSNGSSGVQPPPPPQQQQDYTLPYYSTEVDAVHESIQKAIDLIQHYSEQAERNEASGSGNNDTNNTIDPDEIYQQLDNARNQITTAWQTLYTAFRSEDDDTDNNHIDNSNDKSRGEPLTEQDQIRIAYLNMITDSFGNVLEHLQHQSDESNHNNNNNNMNVDVLADCLQSGFDLLLQLNSESSSQELWYENDFVWNDDDDNDDMMNDDEETKTTMTPHEIHRQALGYELVN